MLLSGIASILWAEKLPVGDGLGWDGVNYGTWAKNFHESVFVKGLSDYYVQRMAPSAIVHYGTRGLLSPFYGQERIHEILAQTKNIIRAFDIYNLILLLIAVYVWGLIADNLALSDKGKWFGFCCLFINYAIAKSNYYQPVLTDTSAFVLGLVMFYFFLANQPLGILATMLVGAFTWPTIPMTGAIFLAFPRPADPLDATPRVTTPTVRRLSLLATALACLVAILMLLHLLRQDIRQWDNASMVRINFVLLYSSMVALIVYLFFGFRSAFRDGRLFDLRYIIKAIHWRWAAAAFVTLLVIRFVVGKLAANIPSPWTYSRYVEYLFASALTEPFLFLVAHAVYYGPVILLMVIFWKQFCEGAGRFGIGFRLFVILNLALSICPQSRYQIPAVSAFVIVMVAIMDRALLPRWGLAFWVVLSIFYSKVWYIFNTGPMRSDGSMASFQKFPIQHFFMNSGPWMSHSMYLAQGSVVLATLIVLALLVIRGRFRRTTLEGGSPLTAR